MYREERARGVKLQVIDFSELEAQALEYRQKTRPDCYEARAFASPWGLHESKNGHLYAICQEGVGYVVSDEKPLEISFHGSYHIRNEETGEIEPNKHSFDAMAFGSVDLTPEDLKNYPLKEEVDLADHIRTFGSRLESNFWLWFDELS